MRHAFGLQPRIVHLIRLLCTVSACDNAGEKPATRYAPLAWRTAGHQAAAWLPPVSRRSRSPHRLRTGISCFSLQLMQQACHNRAGAAHRRRRCSTRCQRALGPLPQPRHRLRKPQLPARPGTRRMRCTACTWPARAKSVRRFKGCKSIRRATAPGGRGTCCLCSSGSASSHRSERNPASACDR